MYFYIGKIGDKCFHKENYIVYKDNFVFISDVVISFSMHMQKAQRWMRYHTNLHTFSGENWLQKIKFYVEKNWW